MKEIITWHMLAVVLRHLATAFLAALATAGVLPEPVVHALRVLVEHGLKLFGL